MRERNPDDASTYLTLAEIYAGNEWIEDAVAAYQKAISLAPDNLDYIEYFGEFYFRQGNREKTVETWNRMVDADKLSLRGNAENYDRLAKLFDAKTSAPKPSLRVERRLSWHPMCTAIVKRWRNGSWRTKTMKTR